MHRRLRCMSGCAACRRSRELCDGRNPCRNCDERHLVCEDEVSSPVARHEVVPPTMPPPVRTGERAKLACLACRRDNKKCGDQRPCARCISRSEECIHVNRGPKIVKSRCQACRIRIGRFVPLRFNHLSPHWSECAIGRPNIYSALILFTFLCSVRTSGHADIARNWGSDAMIPRGKGKGMGLG